MMQTCDTTPVLIVSGPNILNGLMEDTSHDVHWVFNLAEAYPRTLVAETPNTRP